VGTTIEIHFADTPLLVMAGLISTMQAQVDTGTILGTVRDPSGGVIPNASVTLTNEGTSTTQTATTADNGQYTFTPLRIGRYSVEVRVAGFQAQKKTGVQLDIQQQVAVDFSLAPGQVTSRLIQARS
jgi:Carboxypeptidase regulatory-like domain